MKTVTVLVPNYNESNTILRVLRKIKEQDINGVEIEVIVIDDGSTDESLKVLKSEPDLYDELIIRSDNGGKGSAILAGLMSAKSDYILFQDADLEYSPDEYSKLFDPIKLFDADIVIGSRLIASPITKVSYFWHKVGNKIITLIFNLLNNTTFTDIYSCYLLYRRDLINADQLCTVGWDQHGEILTRAVQNGNNFYEVPISYYGRSYEEGKKIRARHIFAVIKTLIFTRLKK